MSLVLYFTNSKGQNQKPSNSDDKIDSNLVPKKRSTLIILIFRGLIAGSNLLIFYQALKLVPLSTFIVLRNMKGIFVLLMTPIFLDERLTVLQMFLILVSFLGTALIVNPQIFITLFNILFSSNKVQYICLHLNYR
jgi:drug/metabolite transporter (DMT)-like permease